MNRRTVFVAALAATLFRAPAALASGPAFEPALDPPARQQRALTPQEQALLERYDQNGDGRLEPEEVQAAHGVMQRQKQGREVLARRLYDKLLQKFDAEGKGRLTPAEQAQAMAALRERRPRIYTALLKRFDRNGDGQLDSGETSALFTYLSSLPPELAKAPAPPEADAAAMNPAAN